MDIIELLGGLVLLVFGGDVLVRGSVAGARRFGIPPLLIGLTIVGFGTSAPELVVSVDAALSGLPSLAIGNVVGSNIANVLLILGIPAILMPVTCDQPMMRRNTAFMLVASLVFIVLARQGTIDREGGLVLIAMILAYLAYSAYGMVRSRAAAAGLAEEIRALGARPTTPLGMALHVLAGLAILPVGAHFVVDGASGIATEFGVPQAVIGLTVVAVGTSLPELAAAIAAALHRHPAVVVGNVIGSNIFNICAVLGITAFIKDVPVEPRFVRFDLWVMLGAALLLAPFALRKVPVGRLAGVSFILLYGAYVAALARGMLPP
ncbi:MAG: calcium/sodium antiporter [Alphaproteobacteria bacterium]|nr:calcium/sodium antiporter [Alphaproteobacteria bacterium]